MTTFSIIIISDQFVATPDKCGQQTLLSCSLSAARKWSYGIRSLSTASMHKHDDRAKIGKCVRKNQNGTRNF